MARGQQAVSKPGQGQPKKAAPVLLCLALLAAVVASSFGVIHSSHACRELYTELQVLEADQWHLQEEYGRLLLEQSTWASHHRVEKVARSELGMRAPTLAELRVVTP